MADVAGTMFAIDLRTMKNCGNFRGNSGSVRSIEHHSSLPLVASVGLDRHLRVYNSSTKRGMASVYLKQRMNKVLLSRDAMVGIEVDEEALAAEEKEAEEEEALWANLEGVKGVLKPCMCPLARGPRVISKDLECRSCAARPVALPPATQKQLQNSVFFCV